MAMARASVLATFTHRFQAQHGSGRLADMRGGTHHHVRATVAFQVIRLAVADFRGFLVDVFQQAFSGIEDAAMAGDHVFARCDFIGAGEGAAGQGRGDASEQQEFFHVHVLK